MGFKSSLLLERRDSPRDTCRYIFHRTPGLKHRSCFRYVGHWSQWVVVLDRLSPALGTRHVTVSVLYGHVVIHGCQLWHEPVPTRYTWSPLGKNRPGKTSPMGQTNPHGDLRIPWG